MIQFLEIALRNAGLDHRFGYLRIWGIVQI